jgi:hypothetical protein
LLGCARSERTIELKPVFSDETVVGEVRAHWAETGAQRSVGDAGAAEREVGYRLDASNRLTEPLYLRVTDLRLIGQGGAIPTAAAPVACQLAPGRGQVLVRGSVWVPATQASGVRDAQAKLFVLPLSERGRAFYREFRLGQRPRDAAAIDAELETYGSAPPCGGGP